MLDVLKMGKKKAKGGVSLQVQMKQRLNKQQKAATRMNLRDQARQLEKEGKDDDADMKKLRFEVKALFGKIDEDSSGSITKQEFIKSLQEDEDVIDFVDKSKTLRPLIRQDDYESSFMKLDTDGGGSITLIEFFNFCKREADEANIRAVYDAIDFNHDGLLSKEEIIDGMKNNANVRKFVSKSRILAPLIDSENFDEIFSKLDTDSTAHSAGKIDYVEFWKFCKETAAQLEAQKMKDAAAVRRRELKIQREKERKAYMAKLTSHISKAGVRGSYYVAISRTHEIPLTVAEKPLVEPVEKPEVDSEVAEEGAAAASTRKE